MEKIIEKLLLLLNVIMIAFILGLLFHPSVGIFHHLTSSLTDKADEPLNTESRTFITPQITTTSTVGQNAVHDISFASSPDSFRAPVRMTEEAHKEEKRCYLTFDDGPSRITLSILDILKKYNAKATFFIIGNTLTEENREIVEQIISDGHLIGLHANNHNYADFYKDDSSWLADYEMLFSRLKNEYNITPCLYRFPGGSACTYMNGKGGDYVKIMKEKGFSCFDWNVSGEDAVGNPTPCDIYENVLKDALKYNTPIVLLHDSSVSDATVTALPLILEKLTKEGYVFPTLEKRKEYIFRNTRK